MLYSPDQQALLDLLLDERAHWFLLHAFMAHPTIRADFTGEPRYLAIAPYDVTLPNGIRRATSCAFLKKLDFSST